MKLNLNMQFRSLVGVLLCSSAISLFGLTCFPGCAILPESNIDYRETEALNDRINRDPRVIAICEATRRDNIYLHGDSGGPVFTYSSNTTYGTYLPAHYLPTLSACVQSASAAIGYSRHIQFYDAITHHTTVVISPRGKSVAMRLPYSQ